MNGLPHLSLSGIDVAELRQRRMVLMAELGDGQAASAVIASRPWWRRIWPQTQREIERRLLADLIVLEDAKRLRSSRRAS